jgi:hypothetical protein
MGMKALLDKIGGVTEEQKKGLAAAVEAKDMAAVEAFCKKHGIELAADEREAAAEYFKTGMLPLADDELDNVAGGCGAEGNGDNSPKSGRKCHKCGSTDILKTLVGSGFLKKTQFVCLQCRATFEI